MTAKEEQSVSLSLGGTLGSGGKGGDLGLVFGSEIRPPFRVAGQSP